MQTTFPKVACRVEIRHQSITHPPTHLLSDSPTRPTHTRAHSLRNDDGFWELTFNGCDAILTQDQVLFYVAFLLANPGRVFEPLELAEKVYALYGPHPDFRQNMPWIEHRLQQAQVARVLRLKQETLEAILDRGGESEPVKEEIYRELAAVYELQKEAENRIAGTGNAETTAETTGNIILCGLYRLHLSLANGPVLKSQKNDPQNPIRAFAAHLLRHLLLPTIRLSTRCGTHFIYQPPEGVMSE